MIREKVAISISGKICEECFSIDEENANKKAV